MIRVDCQFSPLDGVTEVTQGKVRCQELSTERAVPRLCRLERPREKSQRLPVSVVLLLQNRSDACVGGVNLQARGAPDVQRQRAQP